MAGEYINLDNHLLPLLSAKLPNDPVIRLSDDARQCILINDIRVVLCPKPVETTLFNSEALTIWWVEAFWSTLYFDFVPDLLNDPILQTHPEAVEKLNCRLWPMDEDLPRDIENDKPTAVDIFFKFPHNSLLGVEIAKTLYYRRRFAEALEILRVVLSINPFALVARTLRMILLRNIALDAPTFAARDGLFRQALKEAGFIKANCACESEDFYCENGVVYLAQAMSMVKYCRSQGGFSGAGDALQGLKKKVLASLDMAEDLMERGISVSPSAIRSSYLLGSVRLLKTILKNNAEIFTNPEIPMACHPHVAKTVSDTVLWQIGVNRTGLPDGILDEMHEKMAIAKHAMHDSAISLQSYRPTVYFCHAVALWDMLQARTPTAIKRTKEMIQKAADIARGIEKDNVCIYSFTRTYGEMIPCGEFIHHMEKCLDLIDLAMKGSARKTADKDTQDRDDNFFSNMMTVNF